MVGFIKRHANEPEFYQAVHEVAELCALNALSQIEKNTINQPLKQIVKVEGYINAFESFEQHAQVLNGASDLLACVLGESAGHIRTVVGCTSLPVRCASGNFYYCRASTLN